MCPASSGAVPGDVDARTGTSGCRQPDARPALPAAACCPSSWSTTPGRGRDLARRAPGRHRRPCLPEHRHRHRRRCRAGWPAAAGDNGPGRRDRSLCGRPGRPECPCGLRGCLEAIAAGPAVALAARSAIESGEPSSLRDLAPTVPITAEAVYAAAERGDPLALRVTAAAAAAIGRAVARWCSATGSRRCHRGRSEPGRGCLHAPAAALAPGGAIRFRPGPPAFLGTVEVLPPDAQPTSWGAITVARIGLHRTHAIESERRRTGSDER